MTVLVIGPNSVGCPFTMLQMIIRQSQSLCAGEQDYIHKRKHVVLESLNSLGISCEAVSEHGPDKLPKC